MSASSGRMTRDSIGKSKTIDSKNCSGPCGKTGLLAKSKTIDSKNCSGPCGKTGLLANSCAASKSGLLVGRGSGRLQQVEPRPKPPCWSKSRRSNALDK
jgi:hypothetical protein